MSNELPRHKQLAILGSLVEGMSVRATERQQDVDRATILRLLVRVGTGCALVLDERMVNLTGTTWECDEVWGFIRKKEKRVRPDKDDPDRVGDVWTFTAIDADSKLVPVFRVGKRDAETTQAFLSDFAWRLANRVQITTDGFGLYGAMVPATIGPCDYAMCIKEYAEENAGSGRYSPPRVQSVTKIPICGAPEEDFISTSYAERQNLTMRMQMRRLTRLTNAHSKKLLNHWAMTSLYFAHYNFARYHMTIRCSPAMEAGIESTIWSMDMLLDAATTALATCAPEKDER